MNKKLIFLVIIIIPIIILCYYLFFKEKTCIDGFVFVDSDKKEICKIEYRDVGKKCYNNNDCEGYCLIENKSILSKEIIKMRNEGKVIEDDYHIKINIKEFENNTNIKIENGICGSVRDYWCNEPEAYVVDEFLFSPKGGWGCLGGYKN